VSAEAATDELDPESIEGVAARWLAAEQELARGSGNPERTEGLARELSDRYDALIRTAGREELRLAWEAARRHQGRQEMGSEAWADARRLAELLHAEYQASGLDEK
jgi:Mg-chelatase subunit ChlI